MSLYYRPAFCYQIVITNYQNEFEFCYLHLLRLNLPDQTSRQKLGKNGNYRHNPLAITGRCCLPNCERQPIMNEWLENEHRTADQTWSELMTRDLANLTDDELLKHARDRAYWAGYADALMNVMNEFSGPGDTLGEH